jgi:glutathione synthase/RimK-type ligase-like ATP-grasp enzyme
MTDALSCWLETTPALVVNAPSAMASNGSKPYQAQLIAAHGLRVPETLVTTDADAVRDFLDRHGDLVYKSVSGIRSIVSRLGAEKLDRLDLLRWCPTQFQQYVAGDDYRVHVVGEEVFACRIASRADDYRYAARQGGHADIAAWDVPAQLADTCRRLARTLDLTVAGVDLRLHPDRGWYCFEVNPSPAFTYFEDATGQEIGEAVARVLMEGS